MDLNQVPIGHLDHIQASLLTGLQVYKPEEVDFNLHKPFKTNDNKIVGMVDFKQDMSIQDTAVRLACGTPFVKFNYMADGQKLYAECFVSSDDEVYLPRDNKEAAVCVYAMINRLKGLPTFDKLGDAWKSKLSPFIGG